MTRVQTGAAVFIALALPLTVWAQEGNGGWEGRAFVNLSLGVQTASPDFGYEGAAVLFDENARAALRIPGKSGVTFDLGGGVRLVQNFGVGVTYSRYSAERTATLSTSIPSPLRYEDFSTIERRIPLQREEDVVHIEAIYRIPITSKMQVGVFGGPSYFRCLEDHVPRFDLEGTLSGRDLDWAVAFRDVTQSVDKDSVWGAHGGAEVAYLMTKYFGVSMTMRYSRASHDTANHFANTDSLYDYFTWGGDDTATTDVVTMKHGGMHWNGGVTLRF